jgi:hypothetical protein
MFFIDESGSIPKYFDNRYKHRYFVISFVHTLKPNKLENTYKRAINKLKLKFPEYFLRAANPNEIKGSEIPPFMKLYIMEKLFSATDIKIGQMVIDNWKIDQRFRDVPGRSFNYLIKIIMSQFPLHKDDKENLILNIDNRNTKLVGLTELEGYLYNELVLDQKIVDAVRVNYLESKFNRNIQIADLFAHIIYQRFRYKTIGFPDYHRIKDYPVDIIHPYTCEYLYNYLKQRLVIDFIFPPKKELIQEAASSIEL